MILVECFFSSVSFGICLSAIYPLLFSVPNYFKLEVTSKQSANFVFWASFGEGVLSTFVGYLMKWFDNNFLFYVILAMSVAFLCISHVLKQECSALACPSETNIELK
jgi:uncharacterized membrane protein